MDENESVAAEVVHAPPDVRAWLVARFPDVQPWQIDLAVRIIKSPPNSAIIWPRRAGRARTTEMVRAWAERSSRK